MERRVTWALCGEDEAHGMAVTRVRRLVSSLLAPQSERQGPVLLRGQLVAGDDGVLYLDTVIGANDQWALRRKARERVAAPVERLMHRALGEPQIGRGRPDPREWPLEEGADAQPREDPGGEDGQERGLDGDPRGCGEGG